MSDQPPPPQGPARRLRDVLFPAWRVIPRFVDSPRTSAGSGWVVLGQIVPFVGGCTAMIVAGADGVDEAEQRGCRDHEPSVRRTGAGRSVSNLCR